MTQATTPQSNAYIPGVCNINTAEIAYRRKAGHLGVAIFVVLLAIMVGLGMSRWIRVALFLPAFLAAIGYLQAQKKFCVGYGAAGTQNATEGSAAATAITDKAALAKDKKRTREINLQSAAIGLIAAALTLVIPA